MYASTYKVPTGRDYSDITGKIIAPLEHLSLERWRSFRDHLATIADKKYHLPSINLELTDDELPSGLPEGCGYEQLIYYRTPEFDKEPSTFVDDALWDQLDDSTRAAAALHTAVFREAMFYGHENSRYVKHFVRNWLNPFSRVQNGLANFLSLLLESHFEKTDFNVDPFSFSFYHVYIGKCLQENCQRYTSLLSPEQITDTPNFATPWHLATTYAPEYVSDNSEDRDEDEALSLGGWGQEEIVVSINKTPEVTFSRTQAVTLQGKKVARFYLNGPEDSIFYRLMGHSSVRIIEKSATHLVFEFDYQ